jgi:hypothetical protein
MKTSPFVAPTAQTKTALPYLLERFDIGVVHLDLELHVIGMNDFARRTLPVKEKMPFGKLVTSFHPDAARAKVELLLGQVQAQCPVNNPPPMTMMINIPDRMLLIKVSKTGNADGVTIGYNLVFHDITEIVTHDAGSDISLEMREGGEKRLLRKIPTVKQNRVMLVDVTNVSFIRSEGHYTWVHTAQGSQFCNLNISDIEARLDPQLFLRVHRSYIINLSQVDEIVRDDGRMTLHMSGPTPAEIPVSRANTPALLEQLGLAGIYSVKP